MDDRVRCALTPRRAEFRFVLPGHRAGRSRVFVRPDRVVFELPLRGGAARGWSPTDLSDRTLTCRSTPRVGPDRSTYRPEDDGRARDAALRPGLLRRRANWARGPRTYGRVRRRPDAGGARATSARAPHTTGRPSGIRAGLAMHAPRRARGVGRQLASSRGVAIVSLFRRGWRPAQRRGQVGPARSAARVGRAALRPCLDHPNRTSARWRSSRAAPLATAACGRRSPGAGASRGGGPSPRRSAPAEQLRA